MAKIIFEGIILKDSVKQNEKSTFFRISENTGNKENPHYNYFDCVGTFTEKQMPYIKPGMIVEVVGEYNCKKNEKDGNTFYNNQVYCYNVKFKGEIKPKEEENQ